VQCGKVQQAIDTSVHLNQWNMAIDLARNHNVRDTEPLLIKYAETLLEQNKTFSAVELYRKANHLVDAAKLLFQVQMLLYYWLCVINLLIGWTDLQSSIWIRPDLHYPVKSTSGRIACFLCDRISTICQCSLSIV